MTMGVPSGGPFNVASEAVDKAGNIQTTPYTVSTTLINAGAPFEFLVVSINSYQNNVPSFYGVSPSEETMNNCIVPGSNPPQYFTATEPVTAVAMTGVGAGDAYGIASWFYPMPQLQTGNHYDIGAQAVYDVPPGCSRLDQVGQDQADQPFIFDNEPPTVFINPIDWTGPVTQITGTASDDTGVAAVYVGVTDDTHNLVWDAKTAAWVPHSPSAPPLFAQALGQASWGFSMTGTSLLPGTNYTVMAYASDLANNQSLGMILETQNLNPLFVSSVLIDGQPEAELDPPSAGNYSMLGNGPLAFSMEEAAAQKGLGLVSRLYDLGSPGTTLPQPATLTMRYSTAAAFSNVASGSEGYMKEA